MFVMLLREAIAATVVPYLLAMTVNVSPGFTAWVRWDVAPPAVEPELRPLSEGIATAAGTVNGSPVFNNWGLALMSSRTVTPYLWAIDSKESPATMLCF